MNILTLSSALLILASSTLGGDNDIIYDGLEAEKYHQKKALSRNSIRASYKVASGRVSKSIVSTGADPLVLSYAIRTTLGTTYLSVEQSNTIIWKKEFEQGSVVRENNYIIQLPSRSKYLITIGLKDATGKYDLKWNVGPTSIRNAHD